MSHQQKNMQNNSDGILVSFLSRFCSLVEFQFRSYFQKLEFLSFSVNDKFVLKLRLWIEIVK